MIEMPKYPAAAPRAVKAQAAPPAVKAPPRKPTGEAQIHKKKRGYDKRDVKFY